MAAGSKAATLAITGGVVAAITLVAIHGLDIGKWLHNAGSVLILLGYAILLPLPLWALWRGGIAHYSAGSLGGAAAGLVQPGDFRADGGGGAERLRVRGDPGGRMPERGAHHRAIGAGLGADYLPDVHSGDEFGAGFRGEPADQRDWADSADVPAGVRQHGRSSVGGAFAIFLLIARAIASSSLIFTGLTRLPMTASWDHLVPGWFSRLDARRRTPVNSILFVAAVMIC